MSRRITIEEANDRIKTRFPTEHFEIIQYSSMRAPGVIKCLSCNQEIEISQMSNFFAPTKAFGCVNCHGLWKEREQKIKLIEEHYDIISTSVVDTHTHYQVKCKKCGHVRETSLKNLIKHLECGCETGVMRNRTEQEFIDTVNKYSLQGEYELLSEYKNQTTKVKLRHKQCGFIWEVRPGDVVHGRSGCPKCAAYESKGVKKIKALLNEYNVPYEQEVRLDNSRQRFDFYFAELLVAIEFNGKQHYEETPFFAYTLAEQQERDNKKRAYCIEHGIELIEIPYSYSDEDIKKIITEIANKYNDYSNRKQAQADRNNTQPKG